MAHTTLFAPQLSRFLLLASVGYVSLVPNYTHAQPKKFRRKHMDPYVLATGVAVLIYIIYDMIKKNKEKQRIAQYMQERQSYIDRLVRELPAAKQEYQLLLEGKDKRAALFAGKKYFSMSYAIFLASHGDGLDVLKATIDTQNMSEPGRHELNTDITSMNA
jgi:hypothetical protein